MDFCCVTTKILFMLLKASAYDDEGITKKIKPENINEKKYLLMVGFILIGFD